MKKKLLTVVLMTVFLALSFAVCVSAEEYSGSCGDNVNYSLDTSSGVFTVWGEGDMKNYDTSNPPWNSQKQYIKELVVEEGVTGIGKRAFYNCTALTSVRLPDTLTSIGENSFRSCKALESVCLPDNVKAVGERAFYNCSALRSVTLSNGLGSIDREAFFFCPSIEHVTVPENFTASLGSVFGGCSLLKSAGPIGGDYNVELAWTESVPKAAFKNFTYLESIVIPDSVTVIGDSAFDGCKSLVSVSLPEALVSVGNSAFCDCKVLSRINFPESLSSIGEFAFYNCASLSSAELSDGLETINRFVFYNCDSLVSVRLPKTLVSVGNSAFYDCDGLTSVTFYENVVSIGGGAFTDCDSLASVNFPMGMTSIGESAFEGCKSLLSVCLPESITDVGEDAFKSCTSLEKVILYTDFTATIDSLFHGCSKLETAGPVGGDFHIEFAWTESVPENVFKNVENLVKVVLPNGLTAVSNGAFYGCGKLSSVVIPDGVTAIGMEAFYESGVESIYLPSSVTEINYHAFYGCASLEKIYIPAGVETFLSPGSFEGCISLKTAGPTGSGCNIEYAWTDSIPEYAFAESSVEKVSFPIGLTSISNSAFEKCYSLTTVELHENIENVGFHSFRMCASLRQITFVGDLPVISNQAFTSDVITVYYPKCNKTWEGIDGANYYGTVRFVPADMGHVYSEPVTVDPTCTEDGSITVSCNCGENVQTETVPSLGHDVETHKAASPTCTEIGWDAYDTCSRCDYTTYAEIPSLGHAVETHEAASPTCTEIGWDAYDTCSRCDYTTYAEVPSLGHDVETHEAAAPTCTEIGWDAYDTCVRCDYTTYAEIPSLGHDIKHYEKRDPTCTEVGWDAYDACTRGDYGGVVYIPPLDHNREAHVKKDPTCMEDGWESYETCSRCDYTTIVILLALGHDFAEEWTVDVEPTEDSYGYSSRHCSRCDAKRDIIQLTYKSDIIDSSVMFDDVVDNGWSKDGIDYVATYGYMNGISPNLFDPTGTMTRAMLVSVLWRIEGSPEPNGDNPFADLQDDQTWYHKAVIWAYENEIVTGTTATTFAPTMAVTREQMATLLYRFANYKTVDNSSKADLSSFPDVGDIGGWAYDALSWANAEGLVTGATGSDGVTRVLPQVPATREQVATILMRFCKAYGIPSKG